MTPLVRNVLFSENSFTHQNYWATTEGPVSGAISAWTKTFPYRRAWGYPLHRRRLLSAPLVEGLWAGCSTGKVACATTCAASLLQEDLDITDDAHFLFLNIEGKMPSTEDIPL